MTLVPQRRILALTACCVAINLGAGKVANAFSLPIYLDTIGTILAATLVPPWAAITVGVASSLLGWAVINPVYPFFTGTQFAVALVAIVGYQLGFFRSSWRALLLGIAIAIVAALTSAPVTVMVFGGVTVPGPTAINAALIATGHNIWHSVLTGAIITELLDKVIATMVAWLVFQRLPKRITAGITRS